MSKFSHDANNSDKAIAIPRVFTANSQSKNVNLIFDLDLCTKEKSFTTKGTTVK